VNLGLFSRVVIRPWQSGAWFRYAEKGRLDYEEPPVVEDDPPPLNLQSQTCLHHFPFGLAKPKSRKRFPLREVIFT
jgi:hypothetical protein